MGSCAPPELQELVGVDSEDAGDSTASEHDSADNAPGGSDSEHEGGDTAAGAAGPAPHEPPESAPAECELDPPTPGNVLDSLRRVHVLADIWRALPAFNMTARWEITHEGMPVAKLSCIAGLNLRVDCRIHAACRLHITMHGQFEAAQAHCARWAIFGSACAAEAHAKATADEQNAWRRYCRSCNA